MGLNFLPALTDLLTVISDQWRLLSDPRGGADNFLLPLLLHTALDLPFAPLVAILDSISSLSKFTWPSSSDTV